MNEALMNLDEPMQQALKNSRFNVDIGSAVSCTQEISAFTLLLWDTVLNLGREYKWIWKRPCPRTMKWIYVLSRYFPLPVQLANIAFVWCYMSKAPLPIPFNVCRDYFASQVAAFKCALFLFDMALIMKVYAISKKDPYVARWLFAFMMANILVSVYSAPLIRNAVRFDSTCGPYAIPRIPFLVIMISSMIRYIGKGYFVFVKSRPTRRSTRRSPRSQMPWTRPLQIIDTPSFSALIGAFGVLFATLPYTNTPSPNHHFTTHSLFLWPITVLSILSTRLILSMREGTRTPIDEIEGEAS